MFGGFIMTKLPVQPRILRASQAPGYLGMCKDEFNKSVRPHVQEFPIGQQGVGFDRHELDEWADAYIAANAVVKEPKPPISRGRATRYYGSGYGRSVLPDEAELKRSKSAFEDALALVTGKKKK